MKKVHDKEVIHRDLSPTNILLVNGNLKIADFGLGKNTNNTNSYNTTHTNILGQFDYADPDIIHGKYKDEFKYRYDIYSIGRIINYILSKDPTSNNHQFKSICEKATCPVEYRYESISNLLDGFNLCIEAQDSKQYKEKVFDKLKSEDDLDENDINNIFYLDDQTLFEINKHSFFRTSIVRNAEKHFISDQDFIDLIDRLINYSKNYWNRLSFDDLDNIGYLGSVILLSKCSFIVKEKGIECANICIKANRFTYKRMIKRDVIDNIEPELKKQLDPKIFEF